MLTHNHLIRAILFCGFIFLLISWATCAFAQTTPSHKLLAGFISAQSADLGTTCYAIGHGFHEGNPAFRRNTCTKLSLIKLSAVSSELLISHHYWRSHPNAAKAILFTGLIMGTFGATWNTIQMSR